MLSLDPLTFFLWDQPRLIVDIRQKNAFLKGSLEHAISIPVTEHETPGDFRLRVKNLEAGQALHLIDQDGKIAGYLSGNSDSAFLEGGYKFFRTWRDKAFEKGPPIRILGGYTGSGKTDLLGQLKKRGHQTIDLEELASHSGSVFRNPRHVSQPLHEHFQNRLLKIWLLLDPAKPVWIEEKGPFLGTVGLPKELHRNMENGIMAMLDVPLDERLDSIKGLYGSIEPAEFRLALRSLETRMGTSNCHKALHFFTTGQTDKCFRILLEYYDSAYTKRRTASWSGRSIHIPYSHRNSEPAIKMLESI